MTISSWHPFVNTIYFPKTGCKSPIGLWIEWSVLLFSNSAPIKQISRFILLGQSIRLIWVALTWMQLQSDFRDFGVRKRKRRTCHWRRSLQRRRYCAGVDLPCRRPRFATTRVREKHMVHLNSFWPRISSYRSKLRFETADNKDRRPTRQKSSNRRILL